MASTEPDVRWWQRIPRWFASTRLGSWIFSVTLHHIDRVLMEVSDGRISIPRVLAGLPVIRLTTIGAKSGKDRTVPLLGFQDEEKWFVVASNWGDDDHPAWYYNLQANPEVRLTHDGETGRYIARDATDEERAEYWEQASAFYPGYDRYMRRSGEREIPVVVLTPADE